MDYGTYRGIYTIVMMIVFAAIIWWAYNKHTKKRFDDAANSILGDDDLQNSSDKARKTQQD